MEGIHQDPYYGPLINSYNQSILKSGMLLDEDLEVFLKQHNSCSFSDETAYSLSYPVTTGLASVLFSLYLSKKFGSILFSIPPVLITAKLAYKELQSRRKKHHDMKLIDDLISAIREHHSISANILRYIKVRTDLDKKNDTELFAAFNKSIETFMQAFIKCEYNFAVTTLEVISRFSSFSEELIEDYNCLKDIDLERILKGQSIRNINDCKSITKTIQDIHIYMASKLLSYLGIILCSKSSQIDKENLELFLSVRLPHVLFCLRNHNQFVKKQFTALQNFATKTFDYKQIRSSQFNNVPNKLKETLINSINNLQVILEKSQTILQKVDDGSNSDGMIDKALLDVRDHTMATYESLDLLCRLYGILANAPKDVHKNSNPPGLPKPSDVSRTTIVSYDDEIQTADEKYELYLDKDTRDESCEPAETPYHADQSGAYLNLMLRELKQSLKKHERFIEAKKKRGSDDEDDIENVSPIEVPSFDLNNLHGRESAAVKAKVPPNAPPPPPPEENSAWLNRDVLQTFNNKAMLADVIALSRQRNQEEEVFGDSFSESEDSD